MNIKFYLPASRIIKISILCFIIVILSACIGNDTEDNAGVKTDPTTYSKAFIEDYVNGLLLGRNHSETFSRYEEPIRYLIIGLDDEPEIKNILRESIAEMAAIMKIDAQEHTTRDYLFVNEDGSDNFTVDADGIRTNMLFYFFEDGRELAFYPPKWFQGILKYAPADLKNLYGRSQYRKNIIKENNNIPDDYIGFNNTAQIYKESDNKLGFSYYAEEKFMKRAILEDNWFSLLRCISKKHFVNLSVVNEISIGEKFTNHSFYKGPYCGKHDGPSLLDKWFMESLYNTPNLKSGIPMQEARDLILQNVLAKMEVTNN